MPRRRRYQLRASFHPEVPRARKLYADGANACGSRAASRVYDRQEIYKILDEGIVVTSVLLRMRSRL